MLAALLASALGCAETPQAVVVPTTPTAAVAADVPPPPAQVDLSPVAEPADIFFAARWKNPSATLSTVNACAGLQPQFLETKARPLIDHAIGRAFRGGVDGKQIAETIALDAPVDFIVSLEAGKRGQPGALYAFSIGLSSLERAKGALEAAGSLTEVAPGLWRVGSKESGDLTCVIGPAAGAAPARLICGQRDKDVIALGPYLARNLPTAAQAPADAHADLRFTTIDARYGAEMRRLLTFLPTLARTQTIGEPRFDHALEEIASALADEGAALVGDLDHVTLDIGVDPASCLTGTTTLQLRNKTSWSAAMIAERADTMGPPPAIFWRAPVDSDSASYGHAADPARFGSILRALRGLLEGKLAHEGVGSEADRKALAALVALPVAKDTSYVIASGHVSVSPKALPATSKPTQEQLDAMVNAYLGWYLIGVDEGPASLQKLFHDAVNVYGRKGLHEPLRKALGHDADALPTAKLVAPPAPIGKGALDLELLFEIGPKKGGDPKAKGVGFSIHALLMGDGKSSWIAIGANRDDLVKRLLTVKSGAPASGTLAARAGLEEIRSSAAVSSGFFTLATFTRSIGSVLQNPLLPNRSGAPIGDLAATLNNLPHKGETPIFVTSTATRSGPRGDVVLHMQKGTFEDLGTILMAGLRFAGQSQP